MLLENWEKIKKYYEAWWNCQVLDRVPIWVVAPRDDSQSREILSGNTIKIRREEKFRLRKKPFRFSASLQKLILSWKILNQKGY